MHYDNHSERWTLDSSKKGTGNDNDFDTLSVIEEKRRSTVGRRGANLRQSFEFTRKKPALPKDKLRSAALRASAQILSSDVLESFNKKEKEDEEAIELTS